MNDLFHPSEIRGFELALDRPYVRAYVNRSSKSIICALLVDYIPIDEFKAAFEEIATLVKNGEFEKFIFDKRSLRAFHQPTMEWYFIHWKKEMLQHGLKIHRKILPKEEWFEKVVQLGKAQIIRNHPTHILDQLDIAYCDTIGEAIET